MVGFARRLVPADAVDPWEAHRQPGFVPGRALQSLECDLEDEPGLRIMRDLAHRAEAVQSVLAHVFVDLDQLLVGEAEIGLADGHQLLPAFFANAPDAEGVVGIEGGALAVAALGIHQHAVDEARIALPFPPIALGAAGQVRRIAALDHAAFDRFRIGARPGAGGLGPYDLIPLDREDSWSQFNPEFNLVYRVQANWSFYGRVATGFKSGGINDTASTNGAFNTPYDPEDLLSFEVGTKFANRLVSLNLAAYHSIYKNFQAGVFVPDLVTTNIINAGEAQFTGVEVEGSIRPFDGFSLNFGGGYLDAHYTDFVLPDGTNVTETYKVPLAPEWNYLLGAIYSVPLGGATLEASANWSWRSKQWATIAPNELAARKAYGTLDARIALTDIKLGGRNTLEVALWGRNLTDTEYWTSGIDLSVLALRQWADPRSVGVEGRIRF